MAIFFAAWILSLLESDRCAASPATFAAGLSVASLIAPSFPLFPALCKLPPSVSRLSLPDTAPAFNARERDGFLKDGLKTRRKEFAQSFCEEEQAGRQGETPALA